jgi:hypothetical protein
MLSKRERILEMLCTGKADRVPLLGGWVLGDRQHQALTGCTEAQYWADPLHWVIEAHRVLGVDGMIELHVPLEPGEYRGGLTKEKYEAYRQHFRSPEDVLAYAQSLPSAEEAARRFDSYAWKERLRGDILATQARLGDMVWMPTLWEVVHPKFEWYHDFGYENYLMFMHLYPEAANRLFGNQTEMCRLKAQRAAELYRELDLVPMTLIGTDICGGGGPLVAPKALREFYWPHVRRALGPLHEAGVATVWHSDGDFRPIAVDILACGIAGYQGFQEEYGVDIGQIAGWRRPDGGQLVCGAGHR